LKCRFNTNRTIFSVDTLSYENMNLCEKGVKNPSKLHKT